MAARRDGGPPPRRCALRSRRGHRVLRARLPEAADETVAAIIDEVPAYADALCGADGRHHQAAVQIALGRLPGAGQRQPRRRPEHPARPDPVTQPTSWAAARRATAVRWTPCSRLPRRRPRGLADLASAAAERRARRAADGAVRRAGLRLHRRALRRQRAGHADELADPRAGPRALPGAAGPHLLAGASPDVLLAAAERAGWQPPVTLTAVLLPAAQVRACLARSTRHPRRRGLPGLDDRRGPPALAAARPRCRRPRVTSPAAADGPHAVVGPARPWTRVRRPTYARPHARCSAPGSLAIVDTEDHLPELVLSADADAFADLRARALAPLRTCCRDRTAAGGDAARVAAAPGPAGRGGGGVVRPLPRQSGTGCRSCGSCTATGSTTPPRCSSSSSRSPDPRLPPSREGHGHQRRHPRIPAGIDPGPRLCSSRLDDKVDSVREMFRRSGEVGPRPARRRLGGDPARAPGRLAAQPRVRRPARAHLALLDVDGLGTGADVLLQRGLPARHARREVPLGAGQARLGRVVGDLGRHRAPDRHRPGDRQGDLGRVADAVPRAQRLHRGDLPHLLLQPALRRHGVDRRAAVRGQGGHRGGRGAAPDADAA